MLETFLSLSPIVQALLAGLFTWGLTAAGAAVVLFTGKFNQCFLDFMLGFAAGVMLAASFWSLLDPAIQMGELHGHIPWLAPAIGFLAGGFFIALLDKILPHLHVFKSRSEAEGIPTSWRRSVLLVLAITMHNIPEGLAVGVAFGAVAVGAPGATAGAAMALAIGIGLQNVPEGLAVAMPLRREGVSKGKSFWYGQLSAAVEPIAAVLGAAFVIIATPILPFILSFAAGAMVFVIVEEVIPASQEGGNTDLATTGLLIGFVVMMILDVALG